MSPTSRKPTLTRRLAFPLLLILLLLAGLAAGYFFNHSAAPCPHHHHHGEHTCCGHPHGSHQDSRPRSQGNQ